MKSKHEEKRPSGDSDKAQDYTCNDDRDKMDEKDKRIDELTDVAKRVQADFENYRKRVEREQQNYMALGKIMIIKRLLPTLDAFEAATKAEQGNKQDEGVGMIYDKLMGALEAEGLKRIPALGGMFDPHLHECVCEEVCDEPKGRVVEEISTGYSVNDFVVRHSIVKISKGKKGGDDDNIQRDTKGDCA